MDLLTTEEEEKKREKGEKAGKDNWLWQPLNNLDKQEIKGREKRIERREKGRRSNKSCLVSKPDKSVV